MEYRPLGGSGLKVPVLSFGTATFGGGSEFYRAWGSTDVAEAKRLVDLCLEAGLTFFDTANSYSTGRAEEILGAAIAGRRAELLLATKATFPLGDGPNELGSSRHFLRRACEDSLRRLGTDHIDLYYMHTFDTTTPVDETLRTLEDLVRNGKITYIGCSNFAGWRLADASWTASAGGLIPFVSVQNEYSLLIREIEAEVVPACERFGVGILPYFPLAHGLLSGKYRRGERPAAGTRLAKRLEVYDHADWDTIDALAAYAAERGRTLLDVAIGGLAAQPCVASVIAGATTPEQVHANVAAGSWEPTPADLAALDEIVPPRHLERG